MTRLLITPLPRTGPSNQEGYINNFRMAYKQHKYRLLDETSDTY